jgi:hypothetical protein
MSRLQFLIRPALALFLVASAVGVVAAACGDNNEKTATATPKATATKAAGTATPKVTATKAAATATPKATATKAAATATPKATATATPKA